MGTSPHHPVTLICDMEATHSKHNRIRNAQNIAPTTRPWQTAHLHLPFIDCQQLQDIRTQPASQRCVQGEEGQLHTSRLWKLHVYLRWRVGGHDWHIWGEGKIFRPISMMPGCQGHLLVHALFDYIIHHMVNICGRCPKKQPHKHTPRPFNYPTFKVCFNPSWDCVLQKEESMGTSPHHPVTLICDMEATDSEDIGIRNAQNIAPTTSPWQTAHLHLPFIDCQQLQDIRTQPASQRCVQGEEGQLHTLRLWKLHVYLRRRVGGHDWHIWGEGKIFRPISMMRGCQGHLLVHALFDYIIHHMVNICGRCPKKQPHKHTPRPFNYRKFQTMFQSLMGLRPSKRRVHGNKLSSPRHPDMRYGGNPL